MTGRQGTGSDRLRIAARHAMAIAGFLFASALPSATIAADATAGRKKAAACVTCHGESGLSVLANAPHLAGQPAVYVAEQLRQYRSGKRASEVMAVISKPLSDQDIDDLAAWYEAIRIEVRPPG